MTPMPISIRPFTGSYFAAKLEAFWCLILTAVLFFNVFDRAEAADVQAANCSLASVQTACAVTSPGDRVIVPAGTATWSGVLTITKDIQLVGAGIGQTIITNNIVGSLISWTTSSNGFCRLSGFDFEAGPPDISGGGSGNTLMNINGTCHAFRMDNCQFNGINEYVYFITGWVYGVIDHCTFNTKFSICDVQMQNFDNVPYGDGSWAAPDDWGTTNALYMESCDFTGPTNLLYGIMDGFAGSRVVIRYCNVTNLAVGSHGLDSTGRSRSMRHYEVYENNFVTITNSTAAISQAVQVRGGTALVWSNVIYGNYVAGVQLSDYRLAGIAGQYPPWGTVNGLCAWDSNNPTLFDSGTINGTSNNYYGYPLVVDTNKNWAVNQWLSNTAPFVIYDIALGLGITVSYLGNDRTTINLNVFMPLTNGDSYEIRQVFATLDEAGYGQGDLIMDTYPSSGIPSNTVTHSQSWPHEVLDPVYVWGNNFTTILQGYGSTLVGYLSPQTVVAGTPKPGYAPLVYPHPLVSSSGTGTGTGIGTGTGTGTNSVIPPSELQAHPPGTQ
jgi:hypothetical protein